MYNNNTILDYNVQCQDLSDFILLGKKGDEVSLLLQAEQKAMKISRRTDPNIISKGLSVKLNARLHFIVPISNPLSLIILPNWFCKIVFLLLFLLTLNSDVYDRKISSYEKT
jgi:hypothetical protein